MSGSMNYMVLMNQGYSLATDSGWYGNTLKTGPAEREEMYRAEMIDMMCDERLKHEKRKEDDEME